MQFKNKHLAKFISILLNKNVEDLTYQDLQKINVVNISNVDDDGERVYDFEELKYCTNLHTIIIKSSILTLDDMNILSNLGEQIKSFNFQDCVFLNENALAQLNQVEDIVFDGCIYRNLDALRQITSLKSCTIRNPYNRTVVNLEIFKDMEALKKLYLEQCDLIHQECMKNYVFRLQCLSLLNSQVNDLQFLDTMPDSAEVYLSEETMTSPYVNKNKKRLQIQNSYINNVFSD